MKLSAYNRVLPLDLSEAHPADNMRRKAQLKRHYSPSMVCIAGVCCSVPLHNSVFCMAHKKGLEKTA